MKYIDADKLIAEIERRMEMHRKASASGYIIDPNRLDEDEDIISLITSLQREQQMPDSTQLIAEWEKEKEVLKQKDFRGNAERMAYNAFLDGFVKGLGYEGTK